MDESARQWLVFAACLPYAVPHDHRAARLERALRDARQRAARLSKISTRVPAIPAQRTRTITLPQRAAAPWRS